MDIAFWAASLEFAQPKLCSKLVLKDFIRLRKISFHKIRILNLWILAFMPFRLRNTITYENIYSTVFILTLYALIIKKLWSAY